MNSIYFQSDKELMYFCEVIFKKYNKINIQWKKSKHWGNELKIVQSDVTSEQTLACFADVFFHMRLDKILIHIIEHVYHFSDDMEVERICDITKSMIAEEKIAQKLFKNNSTIQSFIMKLLKEHINETEKTHYDALITFCMKPLTTCLAEAVGLGIDEMKREEDHQGFIESIRSYLKVKTPKVDKLYVVQGESFSFFKSNGERYSKQELKRLMTKEPLYILGLDENEENISPIITLHPNTLYIYGNNPTEAKTITLFNLFQERVHFLPVHHFPFKKIK